MRKRAALWCAPRIGNLIADEVRFKLDRELLINCYYRQRLSEADSEARSFSLSPYLLYLCVSIFPPARGHYLFIATRK